ncbi:uncharacterized protein LOC8285413 [Ricinus communis]|uniref:COX assembly mitochondrial protein n=1 Tax=Ricinus communis TaxID=3988 RepID=B9RL24_RICCO|nr:uncharacterized protein LOC8285413 [Ricinus communis]XP_015571876.1 uncharacterized protein LOC8285413 [Ricinus communis]EEF47939.1 conserved hypothetical protein [Ricinus communis]|eukprot:XP_002514443.1 uncharacterized protein LOC8285413 [Ricinus communis]
MAMESTRIVAVQCERLYQALCECHRRIPAGQGREVSCRHLNRGLAECLVSVVCPEESEAVRSLCNSGGTALKRSQCRQAQLSLSICLSSHQS